MIGGIEAAAKARKVAESTLARSRRLLRERNLGDFAETSVEVLGAEDTYGPHARTAEVREVVLKIGVRHAERKALEIFAREVAPAGTGAAPGLTGFFGGRPKAMPVVCLYSFLVPKEQVAVAVAMDGDEHPVAVPTEGGFDPSTLPPVVPGDTPESPAGPRRTLPLIALAWGRSGDKGDNANVGIIARKPEYLPLLRAQLSEAAVADWFAHLLEGGVTRYELPGVNAFNFVLEQSLGGGGVASLRMDPQGKAFAQMLLDFPIEVPAAWADAIEGEAAA
jgi:hypothetical protein